MPASVSPALPRIEAKASYATTEDDLRTYIGRRADGYIAYWRVKYIDRGKSVNLAWHWPAFFVPVPWIFYRRLYLFGLAVMGLPFLSGLLMPVDARINLGGLILMVFAGLVARRGYIDHALRDIRRINALGLPEDQRRARIAKAGGASFVAGGLAASAWLGLAALPFVL